MRLPHTVDLLTATVTTDRRGNRVEDWTAPKVESGLPAFVQPAASTETFERDGTRLVTGFVAYLQRPGVRAAQRVRWRGQVYLIDGEPDDNETPNGYSHSTLRIKRVEG